MHEQKDIVLLPFPYSDLTGAKLRPALIVSNGSLNGTDDRICCLVTSKRPQRGEGMPIAKASLESGALPFSSWVKPHRIFTIHKSIVKKRLCTVSDLFYDSVSARIGENIARKE